MAAEPSETKRKILEAATDLAFEAGPGNLSLDAVAAKAGVSKGGLLYHFPSKGKLLEGMVEFHLAAFEHALRSREEARPDRPNALLEAYLDLFVEDHRTHRPPASGLLAALAENPEFLSPVRQHHRQLLDRLQTKDDFAKASVVFLAIQGIRCMNLLNIDVLTDEEIQGITTTLRRLIDRD